MLAYCFKISTAYWQNLDDIYIYVNVFEKNLLMYQRFIHMIIGSRSVCHNFPNLHDRSS